jgi:phosphatidylinositol alpha-mannosyltransferase
MDDLPPPRDEEAPAAVVRIAGSQPIFWNGSFGRISRGAGLARRLRDFLLDEAFDVLHVHCPLIPVLPILAVHCAPGRVVGTFHTNFEKGLFSRLWYASLRPYLDRLDARVAVSRACFEALGPRLRADFRVIPNGVDVERFSRGRPLPAFDDGRFNILFVGRVEPRNGFDRLLRAFLQARPRIPGARLLVVGGGPFLERQRALVPADAVDDVVFAGPLRDGRPDWYASASVVCVPTSIASFGVTLLEAMSAGRPLIAADIEGYREVMRHGAQGEMLDPFDTALWAEALVRLYRDPALAAAYAAEGRRTAARYAWPLVADEVFALYRELGAA